MRLQMTYRNVISNYEINTSDEEDMIDFLHQDVMCCLEENTEYDETEVDVILSAIQESSDWDKALGIMKAAGYDFSLITDRVDLESII